MAEENNEKLGIMIGKDNDYLKTLMDCYPYPALLLNKLISEYDTNYPYFHAHVRVLIHYGDKVSYDDYICMVGNMLLTAREDWYDRVNVFFLQPRQFFL